MAGKVKERKLDCKSQWKGKACMGFSFLALRAFLCKSPHLLHFLQFHHRIHKIHELGAKLMEKRTKLWLGEGGKSESLTLILITIQHLVGPPKTLYLTNLE